jgi:hypothetical protein
VTKLSCDIAAADSFNTGNSTDHWQKFVIGNRSANDDKVQILCGTSF